MDLGLKILKLRNSRKLSQPELSNKLGISQSALSEIESGKTKKIDFKLIEKICEELHVNFEYFTSDKVYSTVENKSKICKVIINQEDTCSKHVEILLNILNRLDRIERKLNDFGIKKQ
ncbi:helix-turn-helix domain-containing protein [Flavobacterium aurantiibacter]|uniref:HTH cro/C1-type domain-containing protein n=1 Tax=Flavobacterium aurantiibacter TaxID=2023067 RepID=A0A255ZD20_9FLAO|nr:helix-turn-helix transcriptional regulator [Flavobacterium aurantiibacter]OYQ38490.1 hypothetical protein CHX27_15145 [Flavobacterium aurantiibacter]